MNMLYNELLARFLGWDKQILNSGQVWFETTDIAIYQVASELNFHRDWNELMKVVDKIRSYPVQLEDSPDSISLLTFTISRTGILMEYYKRVSDGSTEYGKSYHQYVDGNPNASDSESYIEAIYKGCIDFVKFINERH